MTTHIEPVAPAVRRRAVRAAQGLAPFDLLLTGGTVGVVDGDTGTIVPSLLVSAAASA
ncbi:hypothetical protein Ga0074812_13861 [Parafrankia irregularis]|uniref:Uncharacterized protein n=1 Tax=Parafrankia irregularis TaxID=795642 RepID=A0A0S4R0S7_9ACTN|nr:MULTISPECIES: hypothetical protein [Parafrankia]MBE3201472.1 hypothetical protein [Parafrankia sp. CH37]CUU60346.1 hypothetical protein Ga0074812_13861 [Parafrankia irregularis]